MDISAVLVRRLERINRQKRACDLIICIVVLPVALPVMVTIALGLLAQQGRPILYSQERLGYKDQVFRIYKFRTMTDARDERGELLPDTARLTRLGRVLRKTSMDELPQIWNVLRGDMALVGPRPLLVKYGDYYSPRESMRHLVRPGITGYAQVKGRNLLTWDERLELDAVYVERASLLLDFGVLVQTLGKVITRKDISVVPREHGGRFLHLYRSYPERPGVIFRPFELKDVPTRFEWMSQSTTTEYMSVSGTITLESTYDWYYRHQADPLKHDFCLEDDETGDVVAMVGLTDLGSRRAVSYMLVSPRHRGRGFGRMSKELLCEWAFRHRGFTVVESRARKMNEASVRINMRLGAEIIRETSEHYYFVIREDMFDKSLLSHKYVSGDDVEDRQPIKEIDREQC